MVICRDCRLQTTDGDDTADGLCHSCRNLRDEDNSLRILPLSRGDLELVMAWRSTPAVYEYARQQDGPLKWAEHVAWYESRASARHDFVLHYRGRRVGVVSVDSEGWVSIYLGDRSVRGNGVATAALSWLCDRAQDRTPLHAEVHVDNEASRRLFEGCGFEYDGTDGEWWQYVYDP